jgi:hypothetical protein
MVKVTVDEKNKKLFIEADLTPPTPSKKGKSLIVASTRGNLYTGQLLAGKEVIVSMNAYVQLA